MRYDYHRSTTLALRGWAAAVASLGAARCSEAPAKAAPPTIEWRAPRANPAPRVPPGALLEGAECTLADAPAGPWPDQLGVLLEAPVTRDERRFVEASIDGCSQTNRKVADPFMVLALLRLEDDLGLPESARGLFAAITCTESSMRQEAAKGGPIRGDFHGGKATAEGPMQEQAWMEEWCGGVRHAVDDVFFAAACWRSRMEYFLPITQAKCGVEDGWRVAEAMTANPMKYGAMGCRARSKHWAQLARVQASLQPLALEVSPARPSAVR